MKTVIIPALIMLLFSCGDNNNCTLEAYYTKLPDPYEILVAYQDSLFGKYADLVIVLEPVGQVIFSRETSYLPVWKTGAGKWNFPEVIPRKGDGDANRPDAISRYSHVRLIEQSPEKMVVHWRYFPDFDHVQWGDVVEEYYIFNSDATVDRRIRPGTATIEAWEKGYGTVHQEFKLTRDGIELKAEGKDSRHENNKTDKKFKHTNQSDKIYSELAFRFDEELVFPENRALESVSGKMYSVSGHKVLQKTGIVGKALQFDGYYSGITVPDFHLGERVESVTVKAWVALGAFPFGWAPLVQQSDWGKEGFYLGIDENGFPGFHIALGKDWVTLTDSTRMDLFKWYRVTGIYNKDIGKAELYIDGKKVREKEVSAFRFQASDKPLSIGLNRQKMPPIEGRIHRGKWPSVFGIDGLIDEVAILDRTLSDQDIADNYRLLAAQTAVINNPDMESRALPVNPRNKAADKFAARYTKLHYYETWDNLWRVGSYPDIVVCFDQLPANIVFWRGTSYGPFFVTENGKWIGDQSNEDYRHIEYKGEAEGCLEHMSDKQCRHSHVRIIEDTDARKLIHWRYGLVDSRYVFAPWNDGWGGWTDEYWTIYPDGVAIRDVRRGIVFGDGWVETMFLSAPGTRPEDNVELQAYSVIDGSGGRHDFSWEEDSPEGVVEDAAITIVKSKSEYRMFNIYPPESSIEIFGGHSRFSHFHWWNHWPVSQISSDGRGARAADRLAHSSLAWGAPGAHHLLYGITNKKMEELSDLAKSWRNPPELSDLIGGNEAKYIQEERSWHITVQDTVLYFLLNATRESPVYNPAFVLKRWGKSDFRLTLNDKEMNNSPTFRYGYNRTAEGTDLIIWLEHESAEKLKVKINPSGRD